jgi:hypothetical protein
MRGRNKLFCLLVDLSLNSGFILGVEKDISWAS